MGSSPSGPGMSQTSQAHAHSIGMDISRNNMDRLQCRLLYITARISLTIDSFDTRNTTDGKHTNGSLADSESWHGALQL